MPDTNKSSYVSYKESDSLNNAKIEEELITPDNYYIDLSLMVDIRFGAFMFLLTNNLTLSDDEKEEIYSSLLKNKANYSNRVIDSVIPHINNSKLKLTNELIEYTLHDTRFGDSVYNLSPKTNFNDIFNSQLLVNVNHSKVKNKFKKKSLPNKRYIKEAVDICLHINTYPLTLSTLVKSQIALSLCNSFGVNVKFINKPFCKLYNKQIDIIDEYYVYYLSDFTKNLYIQSLIERFKLMDTRVFASKYFHYSKHKDLLEEAETEDGKMFTIYQRVKMCLPWRLTFDYLEPETLSIFDNKESDNDTK